MINEIRSSAYKRITQTVSYLPHFFSWVVLGGMITLVFSPSMGIINKLLQILGFEPIFFLASKTWFLPILIVTDIWKEVGWASIIYLAAITGVNPEMYEAAIVDGAGRFKRIFYITVPSIAPTIAVMLIMRVGTILDAGFDQVFNLYSTAVYDVADIIDTYIYRMGISSFQYSFTTAAGLFKSVIGFAMILLANYFSRRLSDGEHGVW